MRSARWSLPSGLAAIAATLPLGPLLLIDTRLSPHEARTAAVVAITRLRLGSSAVLVPYADVWEAEQVAERFD